MLEILIICSIATTVVFITRFYLPARNKIKKEKRNVEDGVIYTTFYTFVMFVVNLIIFPLLAPLMFFKGKDLMEGLEDSLRKRATDEV